MTKYLFIIAFIIDFMGVFSVHAQDKASGRREVNIHDSCSLIKTHIIPKSRSKIRIKGGRFYTWFSYNELHETQGGVGGNLVDGTYQSFFFNNQLKAFGHFRKGLKKGVWKKWYENGILKESAEWKNGQIHGHRLVYNNDGLLVLDQKYKKNKIVVPDLKDDKPRRLFQFKKRKGIEIDTLVRDSTLIENKSLTGVLQDSSKNYSALDGEIGAPRNVKRNAIMDGQLVPKVEKDSVSTKNQVHPSKPVLRNSSRKGSSPASETYSSNKDSVSAGNSSRQQSPSRQKAIKNAKKIGSPEMVKDSIHLKSPQRSGLPKRADPNPLKKETIILDGDTLNTGRSNRRKGK